MKPDVIDVFSGYDSDTGTGPEPLYEPELADEDVKYIFSCVNNNPQIDLFTNLCIGFDSLGLAPIDYRIYQEYRDDYIIIEFGEEFFEIEPSPYITRFLCHFLCKIAKSTSCTLSLKNAQNRIETIHFSNLELNRIVEKISSEILVLNKHTCLLNKKEFEDIADVNSAKNNTEVHEKLSKFLGARLDHSNRLTKCTTISLEKELLNIKSIIRHCDLLFINMDSEKKIEESTIDYIYVILNKVRNEISNNRFPDPSSYPIFHMLFFPELILHIPVILKRDLPSYEELWGNSIDKRYIPSRRVLGYYTKEDCICNVPHIVLSPEAIESSAEKENIPVKTLYLETLIHEIAHAIMDNYETDGRLIVNKSDNWPNDIEAKAMEESLANMITIKWFKEYAPNDLENVKQFINNQDCIYRFGLWQDKIDADWKKWFNSDKQATDKLSDWFNRCFSSGNIKIPIEDYNKYLYDRVFE